jgi:uncharacterized membrane protein YdjX (TVP38/TMEM64 family)
MKRDLIIKIVLVAIIIVLIAAFRAFGLNQYLTLEFLKSSRNQFSQLYIGHPFSVIAVYMAGYIAATALSLPGAAVLTLAGGALFGLIKGTIVISFASSIGATAACMVSRYLLRDWVQGKFSDSLAVINQGIAKDGGFYLFTLRLVPIFPFFIINLVMGLTRIKISQFYWISQLGMLPGTLVYVNAGRELGKVNSLSGILSPGLIISFLILGIFPFVIKKIVGRLQQKGMEKRIE